MPASPGRTEWPLALLRGTVPNLLSCINNVVQLSWEPHWQSCYFECSDFQINVSHSSYRVLEVCKFGFCNLLLKYLLCFKWKMTAWLGKSLVKPVCSSLSAPSPSLPSSSGACPWGVFSGQPSGVLPHLAGEARTGPLSALSFDDPVGA